MTTATTTATTADYPLFRDVWENLQNEGTKFLAACHRPATPDTLNEIKNRSEKMGKFLRAIEVQAALMVDSNKE